MAEVTYNTTFEVPIDIAFNTIVDYQNYPDFVEGADEVEVLEQSEQGAKVQYGLNVVKKFQYILNMKHDRPHRVSWELESGDLFKKNTGHWELSDNGDGTTDANYVLDLDFKMMVPKMILKKLVNSNLPAMMKSYNAKMLENKG